MSNCKRDHKYLDTTLLAPRKLPCLSALDNPKLIEPYLLALVIGTDKYWIIVKLFDPGKAFD